MWVCCPWTNFKYFFMLQNPCKFHSCTNIQYLYFWCMNFRYGQLSTLHPELAGNVRWSEVYSFHLLIYKTRYKFPICAESHSNSKCQIYTTHLSLYSHALSVHFNYIFTTVITIFTLVLQYFKSMRKSPAYALWFAAEQLNTFTECTECTRTHIYTHTQNVLVSELLSDR